MSTNDLHECACKRCLPKCDRSCRPKANHRLLLLASYCGPDNQGCTNAHPCHECLEMCNVLIPHSGSQVKEMLNIGGMACNSDRSLTGGDR